MPIINVMKTLISIIALTGLIVGGVMCISPKLITKATPAKITSNQPPIILIHGFNQGADFWSDIGLITELENNNTIHMGDIHPSQKKPTTEILIKKPKNITAGQSALYTISLPKNGTIDIRDSATLLERTIQSVIRRHNCQKVRLISFSAGGLVSREYLSQYPLQHHVASLTTVSTPHLGSEHAWLAVSYNNLKNTVTDMRADNTGNFMSRGTRTISAFTLEKISSQLENWGNDAGVDISSECALMLAEPEDGNYLDVLSRANYPTDIHYHCIITEENILNYSFQKLKTDYSFIKSGDFSNTVIADNLLDLARNGIGKLDKITSQFKALKFRGDGVVSSFSQDINNTQAFLNNNDLNATTTNLEADHGGPAITSAILDNLKILNKESASPPAPEES